MLNVDIDMTEFNRTFAEYMKYTNKTAASALNTKMVYILQGAIRKTKKASALAIRSQLNAGFPSMKERIVMKLAKEHGEKISKREVRLRAKRLLGAKIRSIGFVLSGWLPAMKKTLPYSEKKSVIVPSQRGKDKGGAKPAPLSGSTYCSAESWNEVSGNPPSAFVQQVKMDGVAKSFAKEIASMVTYLEKKWKDGGKQFFS